MRLLLNKRLDLFLKFRHSNKYLLLNNCFCFCNNLALTEIQFVVICDSICEIQFVVIQFVDPKYNFQNLFAYR